VQVPFETHVSSFHEPQTVSTYGTTARAGGCCWAIARLGTPRLRSAPDSINACIFMTNCFPTVESFTPRERSQPLTSLRRVARFGLENVNSAVSEDVDWSGFVRKVEDKLVLVPCISFVVFLNLTDDAGILDFYDRCRAALGERLTHYQAESMKQFRKLDARGNGKMHEWFEQPKPAKRDYYIRFSGGDPNDEVTPALLEFDIFRRPPEYWAAHEAKELALRRERSEQNQWLPPLVASRLRVTLPLDHPLAEPARFRDWVLNFALIRTWPICSAYAGYTLNFFEQAATLRYQPAQRFLAAAVARHPGFDWNGGSILPYMLRYDPETNGFMPLVKRVNWLNVVSGKAVDALGGTARLREHLAGTPNALSELAHNFVIQAGHAPAIGDLELDDIVPAYREIAHLLRPVRIARMGGLGGGFMEPATNAWLNAFDIAERREE
jgi:hypothetical protein